MRAASLAILFGFTAISAAAQERPDRNLQPPNIINSALDPCRYFTPDEPMVGFFIEMDEEGGLTPLRVPKRYLEDRWDHHEGGVHGTQLFGVEVPKFEPITRPETGRRNAAGEPWNWMNFTVGDVLPLETLTNMRLERPITVEELGDPRDLPNWRDFLMERAEHGLTRLVAPDVIGTSVVSQHPDVFLYLGPRNEVVTLIGCKRAGPGPSPGYTSTAICEHSFRTAGVDVRASYLRTELPNWSVIQSNITRFLACATSDAL